MAQTAGSSGLAPMFVAEDGQNAIVVVPGANGKMDRATVDRHADLIRSAGMVLCQLEIPMDTLSYTLDFCAKAQVPVMLDPAPAAALPDAVFTRSRGLRPTRLRRRFTSAKKPTSKRLRSSLHAKGLRGVVLKRGAEGAFVSVAGGRAAWVKPFKVDAIDTVGAGDCFNGAFAVALEEGKDPWEAARFANAASAISVTRKGAQASMPMRADVEEFLAAYKLDRAEEERADRIN